MQEENLNIEYNLQQLVLRALNKLRSNTTAAAALGVSERTLYRYRMYFGIERDVDGSFYLQTPLQQKKVA